MKTLTPTILEAEPGHTLSSLYGGSCDAIISTFGSVQADARVESRTRALVRCPPGTQASIDPSTGRLRLT